MTWTLTGATTNASTNTSGESFVPSPYLQLNIGTNTVTYTITDASGNAVQCSFDIIVRGIPEIDCPADITEPTDNGVCTRTLNPGIPVLLPLSPPADRWSWTITYPAVGGTVVASGSNNGATPTPIGNYTFELGSSLITWIACNISGCDTCSQLITIEDREAPIFTTAPITNCVDMIVSATYTNGTPAPNIYNRDNLIIYSNPDVYTFIAGDKSLDITNLSDNCCDALSMVGNIRWRIDFAQTPNPDGPAGTMMNNGFIEGTGQPSTYGSDMLFPGDGVTFKSVVHTITYTVEDCNGNVSLTHTENITVTPRPEIIKMN